METIIRAEESSTLSISDDSDEDDDLPPNPFTVSKTQRALKLPVKPKRLPPERKFHIIQNIIKQARKRAHHVHRVDESLKEHLKRGRIITHVKKETDAIIQVSTVNEDEEEDFNSPPGLSIFVQPIYFFTEIKAPTITNNNDPFEVDLLTAPPKVLRELVISNTIVSMFNQKPVPATMINWLVTILLMSDDKILSQGALSALTNLLHQTKMCSLPAESFHITYTDVVKIMMKFGANVNAKGDIQSTLSSPFDFKLECKDKELLINNLSNFIKYLTTLLTLYSEISSLLFPEQLIVLLLRVSLDHHVIDSILNIAVMQCIGAVLSCYREEEWNPTRVDQLCQSLLAITDDYRNWYKIVTNIGNITTRSRHLQKQFARTVIRIKTTALVVPDNSSDLDFVIAFIQTLYNQKEEYDLRLLYCLLDVLSMFITSHELSKNDLSNLMDYLFLLYCKIGETPNLPITDMVKDSILRLRYVLQCVPGQLLQQRHIMYYKETIDETSLHQNEQDKEGQPGSEHVTQLPSVIERLPDHKVESAITDSTKVEKSPAHKLLVPHKRSISFRYKQSTNISPRCAIKIPRKSLAPKYRWQNATQHKAITGTKPIPANSSYGKQKSQCVIEYCKTIANKKTHETNIIAFLSRQLALLRRLNIPDCNITDKGMELIISFLAESTSLENIDISNGNLNTSKATGIMRALKNITSLKSLNISNNAVCQEASVDIADFISNNPLLAKLNFSHNNISTGVLNIAIALSEINFIKSLDISRNYIKDDCIGDVVSALAQCLMLEELSISHNLLTFTGIVRVAEGLRGHYNLKNLDVSNNLTSFHSESEFLVDVILSTNQSLVFLNVCGRSIRPRFADSHLYPPPGTELLSVRFPLQSLYLSRFPLFDMLTFKNINVNAPQFKFIEATEKNCPIFDQNIISYYVDHDGGTFYNQDHDFAIVIPPGAVSQNKCVEIKATASHFGPYRFPEEYHPVSSFFWINSNYTFKIPVYLIVSHYAVIKNINDIDSLCVMQAHDHSITDEGKLILNEILNGVYFDHEIRYCVLTIKHFCSFSVQDKTGSLSKKFKALCYSYKCDDEDMDKYMTEVCFCPNSCDCSKVIQQQCNMKCGKLLTSSYNLFDFGKGQCLRIPDDFSKINGWFVTQLSIIEISYNSFKFWKIYRDMKELKEAQDKCEYPPRLQIQYIRNDPNVNLQYSFHIERGKKNKGFEVVAKFPLVESPKEISPKDITTELSLNSARLETTPITMKELNHYTIDMSPHYYDIGLELDIPNSILKNIKNNHICDNREKCREMLETWLDNDAHATWKKLCDALKETNQSTLAEKIKEAIIST